MCGIAGIVCKNQMRRGEEISRMTDAIAHRGPDDWGYVSLSPGKIGAVYSGKENPQESAQIFLGHRRLTIIDLNGSRQPLSNEDNSVWTIFNGEIYNYLELAETLSAKGHMLREKGDTEVLVHLWEEYGPEMVNHLTGMFAFCIYDTKKGSLFLARDRFGKKPLYYFEKEDSLFFASELQAFFGLEEFSAGNVDEIAMAQYFRYGFIPNPRTVYKNVFSLAPGHTLLRKNGENSLNCYWKPAVADKLEKINFEKLQGLLDESVRLRLRSDVPFGSFLSGGIDSALITASMMRQLNEPVKTFTISTGKEYWQDESEAAQSTADYLKTRHREIKVKPDFIEISEKLARHYGQPYADHSSVLTYYVSKETRKFVKVALTGDGGDELFGGYGSYLNTGFYQSFGRIPFFLRSIAAKFAKNFSLNPEHRNNLPDALFSAWPLPAKGENIASLFHKHWRDITFQNDFISRLETSSISETETFTKYYSEALSPNPVDRWMEVDQRLYLCDDILAKVDIASMSVSLECRSPFLDHRLAEYANMIPAYQKLKNGQSKYLLRKMAAERLPAGIVNLKKKGFSMPLGKWIRNELKDWFHSTIFDNKDIWLPYLRENAVKHLWNEHQTGKIDHQTRLWTIVSLALWRKHSI